MGGDPDENAAFTQRFELTQVLGNAFLPKSCDPTAAVSRVEQDKSDPRLLGGVRGCERLLEPDVVELADGGIAGAELLPIDVDVVVTDVARCET